MAGPNARQILNLAGRPALPRMLAERGHRVFSIHKDDTTLDQVAQDPRIIAVAAEPEALPFHPCTFHTVLCHQVFADFAPGLALSEIARVLAPGGHFCVSLLARDDSVPWVRRLAALVHDVDPDAMSGDFGVGAVEALTTCKYFPAHEQRDFRIWVPVSREGLVDMVTSSLRGADPTVLGQLSDEVTALFQESAPGTGPLRLPYQLRVWRAWVDHQELTAPIEYDDSGLVIPI